MRTVLVLGAAGRVGEAISKAFVARGWHVRAGARRHHHAGLAEGTRPVEIDAFDQASLIAAAEEADVVVNALNPLYTEWEKVMPMARNVAAAARASGALHMLPGNIYNFGYGVRPDMAEDMASMPSTPKAVVRIQLEDLFRREAEDGLRTVVIRAGDFYGGKRPGTWLDAMILKRLGSNIFTWPGPTDIPHAFAYLPDLAEAFVGVAEAAARLDTFDTLHFEGHTLTGLQMKAHVEAAIGRQLALRGVPWPFVRLMGLAKPMLREVAIMSYLWRMPHSLDGSRLAALLPLSARTSAGEAIERAVADIWPATSKRRAA